MALLIVIVTLALIPLPIGWVLARWRVSWSVRRVVLSAGLPIAGSIAAIGLLIFVLTFLTTPEQCSFDQCLEDRATSEIIIVFTVAEMLAGLVSAWLGVYFARRKILPISVAKVFD